MSPPRRSGTPSATASLARRSSPISDGERDRDLARAPGIVLQQVEVRLQGAPAARVREAGEQEGSQLLSRELPLGGLAQRGGERAFHFGAGRRGGRGVADRNAEALARLAQG